MEKTIDATFDGEVFRPDEPVDLEPNTKVKIQLNVMEKRETGEPYSFFEFAQSIDIDLPPDFATNLNDYLYGGKPFGDE